MTLFADRNYAFLLTELRIEQWVSREFRGASALKAEAAAPLSVILGNGVLR